MITILVTTRQAHATKKEIGKFKDERSGMALEEFWVEVKTNQIIHTDVTGKQIVKCTKAGLKKAYLRHHHYKDTLNNLSTIKVKQNVIKSKQHSIGTYHQNKVALTAFDTKRWICEDGIKTLAHGYYETRAENGIDWGEPVDIL